MLGFALLITGSGVSVPICVTEHRRVKGNRSIVYHVLGFILRVVEQIEELHAELHSEAFRQFEVLVKPHVHVPRWRSGTNSDARSSDSSQLISVDAEHIRIQPGLGIGTTGAARFTSNAIRSIKPVRETGSYTGGVAKSLD